MRPLGKTFLAFEIKWLVGVRTAAIIAGAAGRFDSEITLTTGGLYVSAKDVMAVLLVCSMPRLPDGSFQHPESGSRCLLTVEGPDAAAALEVMTDLFTCGDRTDRCGNSGCPSDSMLIGLTPRSIDYVCSKNHRWTVSRGFPASSASFQDH